MLSGGYFRFSKLIKVNMSDITNKINKKKRQRSENWLEEDKHLLTDLVRERVSIIENKNTDTNTNTKKVEAWADLLTSFNCMCKGGTRTLTQLKSQWSIIKMSKKKQKAEERKYILQTGGGPPPPPPANPDSNDIYSWLPHEFVIDTNEFDSDQINQIKVRKPSQNENEVNEIFKKDVVNEIHEYEVIKVDKTLDIVTQSKTKEDTETPLQEIQNIKVVSSDTTNFKKRPDKKPKKTYENESKASKYAASIANTEIECRKELHQIQMENEKRKARNLDMEEALLKAKIALCNKKLEMLQ